MALFSVVHLLPGCSFFPVHRQRHSSFPKWSQLFALFKGSSEVRVVISLNKNNHYQTTCLEVYIYLCLVKLRVKLNSAEQECLCLIFSSETFIPDHHDDDRPNSYFSNPAWKSSISSVRKHMYKSCHK